MCRELSLSVKGLIKLTPLFPVLKKFLYTGKKLIFQKYDSIFCDITNTCNLRCPHCYNNWNDEYLKKPIIMKKECFEKIIPTISMTKKGMFHLSCAFEPTLNPDFNEFLKLIPDPIQNRICFTSNLTTNISDTTFELLSSMKFDHINISIESFDKNQNSLKTPK